MTGATVLTRFTADTKDFDSKTKKVAASVSSIAKGVIAATGVTKALGAAWAAVTKNMDSAIDRFDVLNNFPKVMSNLGIGADEAQKSIDTLSEKLVGLPTTLQDGALAVQRLTSKNGDIKKSTDLFLAMNNAILAGGASSQVQASAIEQLSQAYAKGKPDMMEWRSIMTAMPAQLKQVATAMGYVNADELGVALREGSVSMDEFMDTIDRLNKEGLEGFQNFEEQARNATGGIRTAITNMNSRIAAGVTEAIKSIDEALASTPIGGIAKMFETIGSTMKLNIANLGVELGNLLKGIFSGEMSFTEVGETIASKLGEALLNALTKLNSKLPGFIKNFFEVLTGIITGLTPYLPSIIKALLDGAILIITTLADQMPVILPPLIDAIVQIVPLLIDYLPLFISAGAKLIGALLEGLIKSIPSLLRGTKNVANSVVDVFKSIPGMLWDVGVNIVKGLWNGMAGIKDWVISKVKGMGKSILNGLKSVLGIHSPSTEFALVGKYSVLGYTEALDKMDSEVQKQIAETFGLSPEISPNNSMHYSPTVQVYNNVDIQQDPLGQMVSNIKTFSGGAKNDYNYGAGV